MKEIEIGDSSKDTIPNDLFVTVYTNGFEIKGIFYNEAINRALRYWPIKTATRTKVKVEEVEVPTIIPEPAPSPTIKIVEEKRTNNKIRKKNAKRIQNLLEAILAE